MRPVLPHLTAVLCLALPALAVTPPARAQREQDAASAAEKLRLVSKDEVEAETWRQKAEELRRQGDAKGARRAFEEAFRRHIRIYLWETAGSRTPKPEASADERRRYRERVASHLRQAAESIDKYFELGGGDVGLARGQLKTIQTYAELMKEPAGHGPAPFFGHEVDRKAVILSKPLPAYTQEARWDRVSGTVILRMVLAADGRVKHILVIKGLPAGLTENAIAAASAVKFEPAVKDGQPVSVFVTLEYGFRTH